MFELSPLGQKGSHSMGHRFLLEIYQTKRSNLYDQYFWQLEITHIIPMRLNRAHKRRHRASAHLKKYFQKKKALKFSYLASDIVQWTLTKIFKSISFSPRAKGVRWSVIGSAYPYIKKPQNIFLSSSTNRDRYGLVNVFFFKFLLQYLFEIFSNFIFKWWAMF